MSGAPYMIPAMPLCLGATSSLAPTGVDCTSLLLSEDIQYVGGLRD